MKAIIASALLASAVAQESPPLRNRYRRDPMSPTSEYCTLHKAALLQIPGEHLREDFVYECVESNGVGGALVMNSEQKTSLGDMIGNGALELGVDQIDIRRAKRSGNKIMLPNGKINTRKGRGGGSGRRLANVTGKKPILAVKVIDVNGLARSESLEEISYNIFGGGDDLVNLKSQLFDCSFAALEVTTDYSAFASDAQMLKINEHVADTAPGVMEATIAIDITQNDRYTIHNAVTAEVNRLLGFSLPGPFEQVMYVIEKCYVGCGWAAYAYINSWMSVYQSNYYYQPGVQVHELGKMILIFSLFCVNILIRSDCAVIISH